VDSLRTQEVQIVYHFVVGTANDSLKAYF